MRYYLNILLPDELTNEVSGIEKEWQGSSKSPPHLTVLTPRSAPADLDEAEMVKELQRVAQQIAPFAVSCDSVDYFDDFRTLIIKVFKTDALLNAHQTLKAAVNRYLNDDGGPFDNLEEPHITLANHLTPEGGRQAFEALKDRRFQPGFPCYEICLMGKSENDKTWQEIVRLPLGKSSA